MSKRKKNSDIIIKAKKVNVYYSKCGSDIEVANEIEICDDEDTEIEENDNKDEVESRIPVNQVCHVYGRDVKNGEFTVENTKVVSTDSKVFNAYHHYAVLSVHDETILNKVDFQEGPIKEVGLNGVFHEDLLLMVIDRLESFQDSEFKCSENDVALKHLYAAVKALRSRTNKRKEAGIVGTSKVDAEAPEEKIVDEIEICDDEDTEIEENDNKDEVESRIPVNQVCHVYGRDVKNAVFTNERW